jgi:ubiquinone/menaquinone biosynthesis C-methylase UbiE
MDDRELFKGTAQYYATYRRYTPELFDFLVQTFGLNGSGKLLDLGCGTGQLTIPLAKHFKEVVGLDIEEDMIDEAKRQGEKAGTKNITWILEKAENIFDTSGPFRLTTIGAAFHWMDQKRILENVYNLTEKDGAVAIIYDSSGAGALRDTQKEKWKEIQRDMIRKYLGEKRRAGNSFYNEPAQDFESFLDASPFDGHYEWAHDYVRTWTVDSIIGFLYTTSFATQRHFGERIGEFETELRHKLLELEPSGSFSEGVQIHVLYALKK